MASMIVSGDRARRQCLGLHLEVDFGIAVGGFERDVTESRTDGVDVHAGAEQVYGRCVAYRMGTDSLRVERGHSCGSPGDRTFDERVNTEPRQRLAAHVEKHRGLS